MYEDCWPRGHREHREVIMSSMPSARSVAIHSLENHCNSPTDCKLTVHFTSRNPGRDNVERRITTVTTITQLGIDPELEISPPQEPSREIDRFQRHAAACQADPRTECRIRPEQRSIIVGIQKYAEARVPQVLARIGYRAERNTPCSARVQAGDHLKRRRLFVGIRAR